MTNLHRDMKPISNGQKYPKFSEYQIILVIAQVVFEIFKFKVMAPLGLV